MVAIKLAKLDRDIEAGNVYPLPADLETSTMRMLEHSARIDPNHLFGIVFGSGGIGKFCHYGNSQTIPV